MKYKLCTFFLFLCVTLRPYPLGSVLSDDNWLYAQQEISIEKLLKNISPEKTSYGVVIASPSTKDPDYFYHWVRDAALVMNVVSDLEPTDNLLFNFSLFSRQNQIDSGFAGIGEPKYYVDGKPYDKPWGRPQNDGPALRASALIKYANQLLERGEEKFVRDHLYSAKHPAQSVIKIDLEYVAKFWKDSCIDLWEERWGHHFYTRLVQRRSLLDGAQLATILGDTGAADHYFSEAAKIQKEILNHRSVEKKYIVSTINGPDERFTQLDTSVILAVLHAYDENDPFFSASNDWILATAYHLKKEFNEIYTINESFNVGSSIGRYPEDVYYGGNPWFLTTLAFAELYYKALTEFKHSGVIEITDLNIDFFNSLKSAGTLPIVFEVGQKYYEGEIAFNVILSRLKKSAWQFFKRAQIHLGPKGEMAEQIDRNTGEQLSARDLTWSYASFLTALWARNVALESF